MLVPHSSVSAPVGNSFDTSVGSGFHALHHRERLDIVNRMGDIGVVTLWSPLRAARRAIDASCSALLDPTRSRIAVIANLYGDGMYAMLCNLLFNPQMRHLVAIGEDLGLPTCEELEAFFGRGLEDAEMLGAPVKRIRGTGRVFPVSEDFDEAILRERVSFRYLGKLSTNGPGLSSCGACASCPRTAGRAHASVFGWSSTSHQRASAPTRPRTRLRTK